MTQPQTNTGSPPATAADPRDAQPLDDRALGEPWPGIQLYYPPVKYSPHLGIYETLEDAALRMRKHAWETRAHTLIFDLEDGCRQKAMSRTLLRQELAGLREQHPGVIIALRINPFRTEEYELDMALVQEMGEFIDVVMLAKAGEAYGAAEVRDLSNLLVTINPRITIQPIIEHPKSLKVMPELMQYPTVKHVVFGIHDFSKAMGIRITPENWIEELKPFLYQVMFEARIAGKGVIGGVETLIGSSSMPEDFLEPHDVRRWLDLHGEDESRIVYKHAVEEATLGLTGKQVIHPGHIHLCKVAYTPSPTEIRQKIAILKAAIDADALLGGAIRFEGEMLDPPMFGKALQTLLRANALRSLGETDRDFAMEVLTLMPNQVIRENWPYGVLL